MTCEIGFSSSLLASRLHGEVDDRSLLRHLLYLLLLRRRFPAALSAANAK
jgi:hypothetical protein